MRPSPLMSYLMAAVGFSMAACGSVGFVAMLILASVVWQWGDKKKPREPVKGEFEDDDVDVDDKEADYHDTAGEASSVGSYPDDEVRWHSVVELCMAVTAGLRTFAPSQ